jgi:hypothetical protein
LSSHNYANILLDLEARKDGLNLEKSLKLDVRKVIASQLDNARVALLQQNGLENYKDLGTEQKSQEAFDQDAMAYATMTIASDHTLNSNT